MKVLHVSNSNIFSGMESVALSIMTSMPEHISCAYLTASGGSLESKLKEAQIEYTAFGKVNEKALAAAVEEYSPDIIHAYEYECSQLCSRVTNSIPVVSHLYSAPKWTQKISPKSVIYAGLCKNFAKIILTDDTIEKAAWFSEKLDGKTAVMGVPFDAGATFEKGYVTAREMSAEKREAYKSDLLFMGRLSGDKNPLEFIRIVADVKKHYPGVKAIMVGGGDLGGDCLKLITKLSLEDNVFMAGFQSNPYIYMNETRILVIPSVFEGYGMAALEAMAFGKPVLASFVGALPLNVDDEVGKLCGIAKKPVDRAAFVGAACALLNDGELYAAKAEAARRRAKGKNNFSGYMEEMQRIYEEIYENIG